MSGDVVAAIDAALADNTVSPDAMRHAPDAPEPAPVRHTDHRCTLHVYDEEQVWTREQLAEFQAHMERMQEFSTRQARRAARIQVAFEEAFSHVVESLAVGPDDFALMPPRPQNPEPFGFTTEDIPTLYTGLLSRRFAPWPKYSRVVSNTELFPGTDIAIHYSPPQTTIDPDPLVIYEPVWPPPFVAHTGQTAITMEAPGER